MRPQFTTLRGSAAAVMATVLCSSAAVAAVAVGAGAEAQTSGAGLECNLDVGGLRIESSGQVVTATAASSAGTGTGGSGVDLVVQMTDDQRSASYSLLKGRTFSFDDASATVGYTQSGQALEATTADLSGTSTIPDAGVWEVRGSGALGVAASPDAGYEVKTVTLSGSMTSTTGQSRSATLSCAPDRESLPPLPSIGPTPTPSDSTSAPTPSTDGTGSLKPCVAAFGGLVIDDAVVAASTTRSGAAPGGADSIDIALTMSTDVHQVMYSLLRARSVSGKGSDTSLTITGGGPASAVSLTGLTLSETAIPSASGSPLVLHLKGVADLGGAPASASLGVETLDVAGSYTKSNASSGAFTLSCDGGGPIDEPTGTPTSSTSPTPPSTGPTQGGVDFGYGCSLTLGRPGLVIENAVWSQTAAIVPPSDGAPGKIAVTLEMSEDARAASYSLLKMRTVQGQGEGTVTLSPGGSGPSAMVLDGVSLATTPVPESGPWELRLDGVPAVPLKDSWSVRTIDELDLTGVGTRADGSTQPWRLFCGQGPISQPTGTPTPTSTYVPTTIAPSTSLPPTTQPPFTAGPTTAAPTTPGPTTQPPFTAAPTKTGAPTPTKPQVTTAPPNPTKTATTAAPTTKPPSQSPCGAAPSWGASFWSWLTFFVCVVTHALKG